ncbi:PDZ domain-containing protein 8 [Aplysia californica]|uniref:PDZ domain-containing protein 8 n=1 Tax=Aplysia californica TaxID=6500 RepID=A0ABM1AFZ6_APLCA|nr:PDZ domain-containing protein 8 [Aplysia californica]
MATTDGTDTALSVWETIGNMTPFPYLLFFLEGTFELFLDRSVLVILSFLVGVAMTLVVQALFLRHLYGHSPTLPPPVLEQRPVQLPEVLKNRLNQQSLKQKEECVWLNFLSQFLFSELRESLHVRRFITRKIQTEFEEVLKSRGGVLMDELFLRDFALGNKFPVVMGLSVESSEVKDDVVQTLDLKARVVYDGGFQIAIDAALPFGRMAFVSVKVMKIRGLMRFQFTLLPFSHWSMSFYEEPEVELDVTAQLDGHPMPKLKNIIANQIKRIIRKKHTLPMYKMRFKPFFLPRPEGGRPGRCKVQVDGTEVGRGVLEVTVVSASRLPIVMKGAQMYCTLSVDALPWRQMVAEQRKQKTVLVLEMVKKPSDLSLGLTVKDEFLGDRLNPAVVVEQVLVGSPGHMAGIREGDILLAVAETKVSCAKQATKTLKAAKDKIQVQIERESNGEKTPSVNEEDIMSTSSGSLSELMNQQSQSSESEVTTTSGGVTTSASADLDSDPSLISAPKSSTSSAKGTNVRKTRMREASESPHWGQKFVFSVVPSTRYLNVCVWSCGGDRAGKTQVMGASKRDVLVGYASLDLDDIYLHCLVTLNGSVRDKVKLKHGHYKTEAELVKLWSVHKGWDPNLMYGDVLLSFHFLPSHLSVQQRQAMASCKTGLVSLGHHQEEEEVVNGRTDLDLEKLAGQGAQVPTELRKDLNEGHHQFDSTTFVTATFCDYCGKKIWMKEAFKCRSCHMVCHKKCLVKCLVNTFCTEDGVRKRGARDEPWQPLTAPGRTKTSAVEETGKRGSSTSQAPSEEYVNIEDEAANQEGGVVEANSVLGTLGEDELPTSISATENKSNSQTSTSGSRFQLLRDQTERMKENVVRHLRKAKVQSAGLSDKAIVAAKDTGGRLFFEMDPILRKDKLEELLEKLDEQLKEEMANKEGIDEELHLLEQSEPTNPRYKSEVRALNNRAVKSVEKQDAMRLLMLQYCSGLQNCLASLEQEEGEEVVVGEGVDGVVRRGGEQEEGFSVVRGRDMEESLDVIKGGGVRDKEGEGKMDVVLRESRASAVGGFVRRASSSVKEKMSSLKKDFVRKGLKGLEERGESPPRSSPLSINNSRGRVGGSFVEEGGGLWKTKQRGIGDGQSGEEGGSEKGEDLRRNLRSRSEGAVHGVARSVDAVTMNDAEKTSYLHSLLRGGDVPILDVARHGDYLMPAAPAVSGDNNTHVRRKSDIQIRVDDVDKETSVPVGDNEVADSNESNNDPRRLTRGDSRMSRSCSDSGLEMGKMMTLSPEDILRYHSNSLPKVLGGFDESDSESDFLVIDSSDEPVVTDSSEEEDGEAEGNGLGVEIRTKTGGCGQRDGDGDDRGDRNDEGKGQHRNHLQRLQSFQV